jgi:catechol 2,3-dioxygenase-like lactoylglutathione lyase family enzyme
MIDHIYLPVSDLDRSSEFFRKMLEPLGIDMPYKFDRLLGFAINGEPGFWLKMATSPKTFTSHSPPRARTLSGPATRRR